MSTQGFEAEMPDIRPFAPEPQLKPVPDELAQIAVFPVGHTALDLQIQNFHRWADRVLQTPTGSYIHSQNFPGVVSASAQRLQENGETLALFKQTFPSFFWTGIECSNPVSPQGERWDQLQLAGLYNPRHRRTQIRLMKEAGIQNVRLGMPNHKMIKQKSWRGFDSVINDFKNAGMKISLDLQHFGLPDSFGNPANPEESHYLNPKWPEHFVKFGMTAVKKYLDKLDAITIINEPLITNRFSSCFWNEAMPGCMSHERYNHFFVKRALLIATAAVRARYEIERYLKESGRDRIIFIHNESCERHAGNDDFNNFGRFLASDLILGHEWLLADDFTQTEMFRWMHAHLVRPEHRAMDTSNLIVRLSEIKAYHQRFEKEFGKTMKADTVFGVDYYAACETVQQVDGFPKPTCVDTYTEQIIEGRRLGLAGMCIEYWNRYQLPILHTETNFVDNETNRGDEWGVKQLVELAQLPKFSIPVLGFTWYSLMDQFNWHNGMQGSPTDVVLHPVGLYSWPDYQPRAFTREVLPDLMKMLNQPAAHHI